MPQKTRPGNALTSVCFRPPTVLFVFSAANSDLYIGSRTLFALAIEGQAPAIFAKVSKRGIPYYSLALCTLFCGLACAFWLALSLRSSRAVTDPLPSLSFADCACATSALTVFKYFVSLISMFGGLTWLCILWSQIRFRQAMAVQGMSRDELPWKALVLRPPFALALTAG